MVSQLRVVVPVIVMMLAAPLMMGMHEEQESKEEAAERAKENSKEAAAALAESDGKKADEDDPNYSKAEALDWLDFEKHHDHKTFKLDPKLTRELVKQLYAAGATKVWVTRIRDEELGGDKFQLANEIVVVLPTEKAKREAVFKAWNEYFKDTDEPEMPDVGQEYLFMEGD